MRDDDDSYHNYYDDLMYREEMESYREKALSKLSEIEVLAVFEDFKEFRYKFIQEKIDELLDPEGAI